MFSDIYKQKNVLVTGHTGFKGSWLILWLLRLGARVTGYSLEPPTQPNHFELHRLDIRSVIGDIRDEDHLNRAFAEERPDIVFHLAAQPIVRASYADPVGTFTTNVMGTVNVLEAARRTPSVRAIVNVTSDKCYENVEKRTGYKEGDPLGGYDPYSASKGCAEIVTGCWRNSFFKPAVIVASARAGNVIGGGDWAADRLVPDIMRAAAAGETVRIRNPRAIRAWQHVLEPLSGYLFLGQRLLEGKAEFAEAWNFGPDAQGNVSVGHIVGEIQRLWPKVTFRVDEDPTRSHEAQVLMLDATKAAGQLHWKPVWDTTRTVEKTVAWYRSYYESGMTESEGHLRDYINDASLKGIEWVADEI